MMPMRSGRNAPLRRVGANQAHGLLPVGQAEGLGHLAALRGGSGIFLAIVSGAHDAILEDERGYAVRIQPARQIGSLVIDGQVSKPAARADDPGRPGSFGALGKIRKQYRMGDVADPPDVVLRSDGLLLRVSSVFRAWRGARIEGNLLGSAAKAAVTSRIPIRVFIPRKSTTSERHDSPRYLRAVPRADPPVASGSPARRARNARNSRMLHSYVADLMDFLKGLNAQQREAVSHTEGPLLILAGAGSGKTRVITHRIAHIVTARRVPPSAILAVTFTNKAANEMRDRVAALLEGVRLDSAPNVSTFHSFCVRLLRRDGDPLARIRPGFTRRFTIYDDDDQLGIVKAAYRGAGAGRKGIHAVPRGALAHQPRQEPKQAPADLYKQAVNKETEALAAVFEEYEKALRNANALDFDDLLLEAVRLLRHDDATREAWNRRLSYVMIDEYQDTNRSQYELMRLLSEAHRNVCVVGDEDQSIYSWRGADIRNILDFERDFPNARTIRLEQNYRSTKTILAAAGAVVENNKARKGKKLWTEAGEGEMLGVYAAFDAENEALFIADTIEKHLAAHPGRPRGGALPHQFPIAADRGGAAALRAQVQHRGRVQLLPARRNQGRGGVPEAGRLQHRFGQPAARRQHSGARNRPHHGGADRALRARTRPQPVGLHPAHRGRRAAFHALAILAGDFPQPDPGALAGGQRFAAAGPAPLHPGPHRLPPACCSRRRRPIPRRAWRTWTS